jgi:hypothetical protein
MACPQAEHVHEYQHVLSVVTHSVPHSTTAHSSSHSSLGQILRGFCLTRKARIFVFSGAHRDRQSIPSSSTATLMEGAGRIDKSMDERAMRILGFFDPAVLAPYREQPDKYAITTDHFEGSVSITSEYFAQLDADAQDAEYINVQFGYRTLKNGELKIAAYLPDLVDKSPITSSDGGRSSSRMPTGLRTTRTSDSACGFGGTWKATGMSRTARRPG